MKRELGRPCLYHRKCTLLFKKRLCQYRQKSSTAWCLGPAAGVFTSFLSGQTAVKADGRPVFPYFSLGLLRRGLGNKFTSYK